MTDHDLPPRVLASHLAAIASDGDANGWTHATGLYGLDGLVARGFAEYEALGGLRIRILAKGRRELARLIGELSSPYVPSPALVFESAEFDRLAAELAYEDLGAYDFAKAAKRMQALYAIAVKRGDDLTKSLATRDLLRLTMSPMPGDAIFEFDYPHRITGIVNVRRVVPRRVFFGTTEYHQEPEWLLDAWDLDRGAARTFAWNHMRAIRWLRADRVGAVDPSSTSRENG